MCDPCLPVFILLALCSAVRGQIGDVIVGGTVSEVVASKHPQYPVGDIVEAYSGTRRQCFWPWS